MMTSDEFRQKVDQFLERSGMSATRFGREAVGDPNLVRDLRAGRAPTLRLVELIDRYIKAQPGKTDRAA
jgi:2,4-dienoyl-CoA reductase-like NADH-dependent reductase (Old Yellow Enzyme family)